MKEVEPTKEVIRGVGKPGELDVTEYKEVPRKGTSCL